MSAADRRLMGAVIGFALIGGSIGCAGSGGSTSAERTTSTLSERERDGTRPVVRGQPIDLARLEGEIVFDDFEDVYVIEADGSNVRSVADRPGPEFDAAWAPDGRWIVYRDSRRGINENDEIYVARPDGSDARNLTANPANDWGPDWSPDGRTIAFNSDRDGGAMSGYLVSPDGSGLRRIEADVWIEYPSFSPDGARIAFMGHDGGDYDIYVAELETGAAKRLTEAPGSDGWPAWSPDGSIAFASERDDCLYAAEAVPCWIDPGGRARRASRRLAHGRRRLESAPRDSRVRAVRNLVPGRRVPPCLRALALRDPTRRDGAPHRLADERRRA